MWSRLIQRNICNDPHVIKFCRSFRRGLDIEPGLEVGEDAEIVGSSGHGGVVS